MEEFCRKNSLFLVKSTFKVLLTDENHYTNKGLRMPETDTREGMYFAYISKDETNAYRASYYELLSNHRELGLLLGYPACCVDFFCRAFSAAHPNPEIHSSSPYTNLSKRHEDCVLLSHFPCRAACGESIALAKRCFRLLQEIEPERAEQLWKALLV